MFAPLPEITKNVSAEQLCLEPTVILQRREHLGGAPGRFRLAPVEYPSSTPSRAAFRGRSMPLLLSRLSNCPVPTRNSIGTVKSLRCRVVKVANTQLQNLEREVRRLCGRPRPGVDAQRPLGASPAR
jgi:hypothetical protein